ncbi:MAG: hypothetical protein MUO67_01425 [Anaerolineales bacterium]|nr:hypothetical protein [Anaerolineales bacterium]
MSAESLSLIAGTLLSLVFSYIPGAKDWFMRFDPSVKRLLMLGFIIISAGIVFGLTCLGWGSELGISLNCDHSGLLGLVKQIVIAIIANQSIYAISPRRNDSPPPLQIISPDTDQE